MTVNPAYTSKECSNCGEVVKDCQQCIHNAIFTVYAVDDMERDGEKK
ncbi:zinc ribbon domain-containing protein [Nostoc sp. FACHB-892]